MQADVNKIFISLKNEKPCCNEKKCAMRILRLIEDNFLNSKFNVNELCDNFDCTRQHLYRISTKYFGHSIVAMIAKARLYYSLRLFTEDFSITQISTKSGFNTYNEQISVIGGTPTYPNYPCDEINGCYMICE